MSKITDEMLAAYLDGELPRGQMQAVERALAGDPTLQGRLARWERADRSLRQALFAAGADIPEAAVAAVMENTRARRGTARWFGRPVRSWLSRPVVAAAAAALVLGIGLGLVIADRSSFTAAPRPPVFDELMLATGRLAAALETEPSGGHAPVDGARAMIIATYRGANGRWCREFQLQTTGAQEADRPEALAGLACRQAQSWAIVALAPMRMKRAPEGLYKPASDKSLPSAIARRMKELGITTPLTRAQEQALIARGWRGK